MKRYSLLRRCSRACQEKRTCPVIISPEAPTDMPCSPASSRGFALIGKLVRRFAANTDSPQPLTKLVEHFFGPASNIFGFRVSVGFVVKLLHCEAVSRIAVLMSLCRNVAVFGS